MNTPSLLLFRRDPPSEGSPRAFSVRRRLGHLLGPFFPSLLAWQGWARVFPGVVFFFCDDRPGALCLTAPFFLPAATGRPYPPGTFPSAGTAVPLIASRILRPPVSLRASTFPELGLPPLFPGRRASTCSLARHSLPTPPRLLSTSPRPVVTQSCSRATLRRSRFVFSTACGVDRGPGCPATVATSCSSSNE